MQKETKAAHRKLMRDTTDKRVRFRLYKSGRNWVIAGMTTFIFGMGIYSTPEQVKADTTGSEETNGDDASIVNQPSVTLQTPNAASTDEPTSEPVKADAVVESTEPTASVEAPIADTTSEQPAKLESAASESELKSTQTSSETTTDTAENESDATEPTTPAVQAPVQTAPAVIDSGSGTSATEVNSSTASSNAAINTAATENTLVSAENTPMAAADVVAAVASVAVSAVNTEAIDVTDLFLYQSNPSNSWLGNTSDNAANYNQVIWRIDKADPNTSALNGYYDVATNTLKTATGATQPASTEELAYLQALMSGGDVYDLASKFHVTATNTRLIDGQITLTKDSKVTISLDSGTLNLNGGTLYNDAGLLIYGEHYSMNLNRWIVPITTGRTNSVKFQSAVVVNDSKVEQSANGGITISDISVVHELYPNATAGGTESYALYPELNVLINAPTSTNTSGYYYRYNVNLTSRASYVTLAPTITQWDGISTVIAGTGTAVEDIITIKSDDGKLTASTTVGADGTWSLDLVSAGFTKNDAIYAIESNSLGDTPGAVTAIQYSTDQSHRTVTYKDAITGAILGTDSDAYTYVDPGTAVTMQGTKTVTLPVNTNGNAVSGLIKDLSLDATTVDVGRKVADSTIFDAVTADKLPVYENYLVQAKDLPSLSVDRNTTGNTTVYYYPSQIIVDPNTEDRITDSIPPAEESTKIISDDPNSPVYPKGVTTADLTRMITETITSVDTNGKPITGQPTKTVTAYFTRTATLDFTALDASGNPTVKYNDWVLKTIDGTAAVDEIDLSLPALTTDDFADIKGMNKVSTGIDAIELTQAQLTAATTSVQTNIPKTFVYDYFALTPKIDLDNITDSDGDHVPDHMTGTGTLAGDDIIVVARNGYGWGATKVRDDGTWELDFPYASSTLGKNQTVTFMVYEINQLGDTPGIDIAYWTGRTVRETINFIDGLTGESIKDAEVRPVDVYNAYENNKIVLTDVYNGAIPGTISTDTVQTNAQALADAWGTASESAINASGMYYQVLSGESAFGGVVVQITSYQDANRSKTFAAIDNADLQIEGYMTTGSVAALPYYRLVADDNGVMQATTNNPVVTIYYYPTTLTIDPSAPDDGLTISGTVTPKDKDTSLSKDDPAAPVYPAGISTAELTKTITQTIVYVNEAGDVASPTAKASLAYERTATVKWNSDGTTSVAYSDWVLKTITTNDGTPVDATASDNGFVAVKSPELPDLIPNVYQIDAVVVTDKLQGNDGSDAFNFANITEMVTYYPATVTVSTPTKDGDSVSGGDDPRKYPEITADELTRSINETVHYVYVNASGEETGSAGDDYKATPIDFSRTATITYSYDNNGKLIASTPDYSEWKAGTDGDTFKSVTTPELDGYTSTGDIEVITVTGDSADVERTVGYISNADLQHQVVVNTKYLAPANENESKTYNFYRQPTVTVAPDGTSTFGLTAWTTDEDGRSDSIADQSVTLEAVDASKNPDKLRWTPTTTVTVDGEEVPATTDGIITVTGDDNSVLREVAYTDTFMQVKYIDLDANGVQIGETKSEPAGVYTTRNTEFNVTGSNPAGATAYLYYIDRDNATAESGTFIGEGNAGMESFIGLSGQTYTIELRHVHVTATLETTRTIEYVYADKTTASTSAVQTATWTADTDLVTYQNDKDTATTYHLETGYPSQDSPTITNFTADILTVAAQGTVADSSDVPKDSTVTVTYRQTTFTPDSPGSYAESLTYRATRQINYVNGVNGEILQAAPLQTVLFTRNYVIDDLDQGTGHYTDWTTTNADFAEVVNPTIVNYVSAEADVPLKTVDTPSNADDVTQPPLETVNVKYYPTTVIVTPDQPKTDGTPTVTGDPDSPKYPTGVANDNLNLTMTRTIHYVNQSTDTSIAMPEDTVQTITFVREATITYTKDANGQYLGTVTYGSWSAVSSDTFTAVPSPEVTGLIAEVAQVKALTIAGDQIDSETKTEYLEVVNYYPQKLIIEPGTSIKEGDPTIPTDPDSPVYPATVGDDDLYATVKALITYINGPTGETISETTNTLKFMRTATITYARDTDGQIVGTLRFDSWQNADTTTSFPDVTSPTRPDQFANPLVIVAKAVTSADLDATTDTDGKIDATKLDQAYTVTYWPNTVIVNPEGPEAPDKSGKPSVPDQPDSPVLPDGVDYADLHTTAIRLINYVDSRNGDTVSDQGKQTLIFERIATVHYDQLNENQIPTVTYGDWTAIAGGSDQFAALDNPTGIVGADEVALQALTKQVEAQTIDLSELTTETRTANVTVKYYPTTITVLPDDSKVGGTLTGDEDSPTYPTVVDDDALHATVTEIIKYIDGSQKATASMPNTFTATKIYQRTATITYDADWQATVSYSNWASGDGDDSFAAVSSPDVPEMWAIPDEISAQTVDLTKIPITASNNDTLELSFTVTYYPTTITVDPQTPKTEGTPTQTDSDSPKYPAGVDTDALNTLVTQTIHYVDQRDGGTTTTADHQATLNFVRTATITYAKDGATSISYSAWRPDVTSDATAAEILAATTFVAVTNPTLVTATSDQASLIVGATGKTTAAQLVDLTTVLANNQTILTTNVGYYLAVIIVTPDSPKDEGEATVPGDPNSPKYPTGVNDAELTHQLTRVIKYVNQSTGEILGTEMQTVSATRTATITFTSLDTAPSTTYSAWLINGQLASLESPKYPDLFTPTLIVDAQVVTGADFDADQDFADVIVSYYPTTVTVTPDKPKDPGTSVIDGDDKGPKYPAGVSDSDLTHVVTRKISYVDPQGNVLQTKEQTLSYTRIATLTYISTTVAPTIVYSDWTGNFVFDGVINPTITGYFASADDVGTQNVTNSDVDTSRVFELDIKYYPTQVTVTPDKPKDPGTPVIEGDDNGPKYPAGVSDSDLTHVVTRNISYVGPDGKVLQTKEQTLSYTRTATLSYSSTTATPTIVYSDWTGNFVFDGVVNPPISGYFTSADDVGTQNVTATDVDSSRVFALDIKYYLVEVTVTPDKPKDPGTSVIDGDDNGPKYPAGVSESDLNHVVTRKISYVDPDGKVLQIEEQTLSYTRMATLTYSSTTATPTIVYSDWTGNFIFDGVVNPTISGYFTSADDVGTQNVTNSDVDTSRVFELAVKYYATQVIVTPDKPKDPGTPVIDGDDNGPKYPAGVSDSDLTHQVTRVIKYVNQLTGEVLGTQTQTAKATRTATITFGTSDTPTITYSAWVIEDELSSVDSPKFPDLYTPTLVVDAQAVTDADFDASRSFADVIVVYYPTTVVVTPDKPKDSGTSVIDGDDNGPKFPAGVSDSDLTHVVTRKISYVDPQGKVLQTNEQTLSYTRTATLTYTSTTATPTIVYSDWTGDFVFDGVVNPTISGYFTSADDVGTQNVANSDVDTSRVFELAVKYYATQVIVTPDKPKDPGTSVIDGDDNGPKYPAGVSDSDLTHVVTRKISYVDPDGKVLQIEEQILSYTRTATLTYTSITEAPTIVYSDWTGNFTFDGVVNPTISGYFTAADDVGTQNVTSSDVDISRVFELAIKYYATQVIVTPDKPKDPGTSVIDSDDNGPKYPAGVSDSELTHVVTRKISYVDRDGKVLDTKQQTLSYTRIATLTYISTIEAPTIVYSDWVGNFIFDGVVNPTISGYFTLEDDVGTQNVTTNDVEAKRVFELAIKYYDAEITVTPDKPKDPGTSVIDGDDNGPKFPAGVSDSDLNHTVTRQISYVDPQGKVLEIKEQKLNYTRTAALTYTNGSATPTIVYSDWTGNFTFDGVVNPTISGCFTSADDVGTQNVTKSDVDASRVFELDIKYYVAEVTVTPDKPKDPGTSVIDGDDNGPKYPAGVSDSDLTHMVTRKISYVDPQGKVLQSEEQTLTYTRTATLTYTNGSATPTIVYSDWTGNFVFDGVVNPTIAGYFTAADNAGTQNVTNSDVDTSRVFELTIKYYATQVTVTPDKPKDPGTPVIDGDDKGPKYPTGVSESDLNHVVTRKISYVDSQGKVLQTKEQTLIYTRTAMLTYTSTTDTPTIVYSDWTGNFTFDEVVNPKISGYFTLADNAGTQDVTSSDVEAKRVFELAIKYYAAEVTVTPDKPKDPGTSVIEGDDKGPKYPTGVTASDLNKTATQTIVYVDEAGHEVATSHIATLKFTRIATITYDSDGSVKVTYSAWMPVTSDTFAAVTSPTISGMTTEDKVVAAKADPSAEDVNVTVIYTADVLTPPTPTPPEKTNPGSDTTTPATKTTPASQSVKPAALPQMGDEKSSTASIIGIAVASLMGLLGLVGEKRRKRNK